MPSKLVARAHPGLQEALERVVAATDRAARVAEDPVSSVRDLASPLDRELAGLLASGLAVGRAQVARDKTREALARLDLGRHGSLAAALDQPERRVQAALDGWKHRFFAGRDAARLLLGARRVQREHGSLGRLLGALLRERGPGLEQGLGPWVEAIQRAGWGDGLDRAGRYLLSAPVERGSACKRLMLYLRWMARPDDGVDLGAWGDQVPTASLVIPVDVHILRLSQNLGLTGERQASWRAARQITARLAEFRPQDPVFYDFALCHLGMVQGCPSRPDEGVCPGCGVRPVCVHWRGAASGPGAKRLKRGDGLLEPHDQGAAISTRRRQDGRVVRAHR